MAIRNLLDRLEGRSTESLEHHRQLSRWHTGPYWRPQRTVEETCNQGVSSNWLSTKRGVVGRYCCHILFFYLQGGVGQPCGESSLQELQHCTNHAVDWIELAISAPWSEESPLQGIQFPRWGSSGLEYGLNNLGWETESYELRPLRGHTHSYHNSGWGWKSPACERRSLLTWISYGEPSRREIRSENHTRPGQNNATRSGLTSSRHTLARTPGSRAIGGKVYRRSLGHICTLASSPSGAGWTREYQWGHSAVSWVAKRSTWAWPTTLQIFFTTFGWSIHSPGLCPCLNRTSTSILSPDKDMAHQPVQGAQAQTSLAVDIRDHRCVVGAHQNMVISQVWEEILQCTQHGQHL